MSMQQAVTDRTSRLCTATKADGTACGSFAIPTYGTCFYHTPELQEKAAANRIKGGTNHGNSSRAQRLIPGVLKDTQDLLVKALKAVHDGTMDPKIGTAMATISNALVRIHEVGELATRLADVEARLKEGGKR